ncbi:MAG: diguanylate cyclase [Ruminococcus sp.]|nr:diguanylate cyclase [Ruminococcus sp.]
MRQFQFDYYNDFTLKTELTKIRLWCDSSVYSHIVFQIYSEQGDREKISHVCSIIESALPQAEYFGCSTNGNIIGGEFSGNDITIICTVFEYPSTKMLFRQYELSNETAVSVTGDILRLIDENSWVKAVELLTTIRGMSMTVFCENLSKAREDIQIFGGGAYASDISKATPFVYSKYGGFSEHGVVFWLLGGDDLAIDSTYVTGWKPLGKVFHVTRSEGSRLYELDGAPAYNVYHTYLNIKNDAHFFTNTLEFPFFYKSHGINILRAPTSSLEDGSLIMTSDMESDVYAQLTYGDPETILRSVRDEGARICDFRPEIVQIFSCAARRSFWGNNEISKESKPFCGIAPTSGFYTSGEFLRTDKYVNQHNVTMVLVGMREGLADDLPAKNLEIDGEEFTGKMALINRLANYINAAFRELEESAIRDGLTKLYNRAEIQRRINERLISGEKFSLIMIDIDNFKSVNDTYGHNEGDNVIIGLAKMLKDGISSRGNFASAGRWGGEEFMVLLPNDINSAIDAAGQMCEAFREIDFPLAGKRTISIGVTEARADDTLDKLLIRVDSALYDAKHGGKNRFVVV